MAAQGETLWFRLAADVATFERDMAKAGQAVKQVAEKAKSVAEATAGAATAFAAIGGAALKLGADFDAGVSRSLQQLQGAVTGAALPLARTLVPAVEALTEDVRALGGVLDSLSPRQREMASTAAKWGLELGLVAMVAGKLIGVLGSVSGALGGLVGAVGFAPILLGLGAVLALVPAVHMAWRENWMGIQEVVASVGRNIQRLWADTTRALWESMAVVATQIRRAVASLADPIAYVAYALGGMDMAASKALAASLKTAGEVAVTADDFRVRSTQMLETVGRGVGALGDEWRRILDEVGGAARKTGILLKEAWAAPDIAKAGSPASGVFGAGRQRATVSTAPIGADVDVESMGERLARDYQRRSEAEAEVVRSAERLGAALAQAGGQLVNKLGEAGSVIAAGAQGAAAGGVWGAIIAVIIELASRLKGFTDLVGLLGGFINQVVGALAPLLEQLFPIIGRLIAVLVNAILPVFSALQPIFDLIADVLKWLTPIFAMVGRLIKGLAPVINLLAKIIAAVLKVLKPIIDVLAFIVKGIVLFILGVVYVILEIVNFLTLGLVKEINKAKEDIKKQMDAVATMDDAQAQAEADAAEAASRAAQANEDQAASAQKAASALLNVPTGYKIALARFNADMEAGMGGGGTGGVGQSSGDPGTFPVQIETLNITVNEATGQTMADILEEAQRAAARQTGSRYGSRGRQDD